MSAKRTKKATPSPEPTPEPEEIEEPLNDTVTCRVAVHQMAIGKDILAATTKEEANKGYQVVLRGSIITVPREWFEAHQDSLEIPLVPADQSEVDALHEQNRELQSEIDKLRALND